MRYSILCLLIFLIVICSITLSMSPEGFADFCLGIPDFLMSPNAVIVMLIITLPLMVLAFYIWNWNTLRTTTESQIIKHGLFNSKISK